MRSRSGGGQDGGMTPNHSSSPASHEHRAVTIRPMGGLRRTGFVALTRRLALYTLIGGMDLDLRDAQIPPEGITITKVSLIGGVDLVVPGDVRVEVNGVSLIGGKDVE